MWFSSGVGQILLVLLLAVSDYTHAASQKFGRTCGVVDISPQEAADIERRRRGGSGVCLEGETLPLDTQHAPARAAR